MTRHIILASKTIEKIDKALQADQGALFREKLRLVTPHISDAYRSEKVSFRSHMGASLIGSECGRAIWYGFRWAKKSNFDGRTLRLFNRGHFEEARFIALLLMIGCQVFQQDQNGEQYRISHAGGHFGGSGDGVVLGLPELDSQTPALAEFKTHGEKSFLQLEQNGVRASKFEHYVQMNVYMRKMGLAVGLYMAVNKNTDALYAELLTLDTATADQFLERAEKLIFDTKAPEKINKSPGFFKCRFCDYKQICHLDAAMEKNCRTCWHSAAKTDGSWFCKKHNIILDKTAQLAGCKDHSELSQ